MAWKNYRHLRVKRIWIEKTTKPSRLAVKDFITRCVSALLKEWILVLTLLGLVFTSIYLKRLPSYSLQDVQILYILWVLFISIKGLENESFFSYVGEILKRSRFLSLRLVLGTLILSMIVTNDVALLIVVPLTLSIEVKRRDILIILEALAANTGSALTPFGNPQNLFIFWFYHLHLPEFISTILPFFIFFSCILLLISLFVGAEVEDSTREEVRLSSKIIVHLFLLVISILAILKIIPIWITCAALLHALIWDRRSFKVDYILLLTFFCFFGFTDNLLHMINMKINTPSQVFLFSAFFSQVISNVPAALFFSDFTLHWKALLWGVSVGGFGNLIGSMANLIAYRFVSMARDFSPRFIVRFHIMGYVAFFLGIVLYFVIEHPGDITCFLSRILP